MAVVGRCIGVAFSQRLGRFKSQQPSRIPTAHRLPALRWMICSLIAGLASGSSIDRVARQVIQGLPLQAWHSRPCHSSTAATLDRCHEGVHSSSDSSDLVDGSAALGVAQSSG